MQFPKCASGSTVVCIGTGPSLTSEQIDAARRRGFCLFGCNRVFELADDLALLYACNVEFWAYYWHRGLAQHGAAKWTSNMEAAERFGLSLIAEKNAPGLSHDPALIHHGHGSGYSLVNLAFHAGASRIILLGYDLKYSHDYDGRARHVGSGPRHYFGEYPAAMQHWPSVKVENGVHVELLGLYRSIAVQGAVEVLNATPNSAIDCFERVAIANVC